MSAGNAEREAMLPCPFCKQTHTLKVTSASELFSDEDADMPYLHSETYAVICDASQPDGPGGCGGQGGFKSTEADAIATWNRRATLSQQGGGAVAEPDRDHFTTGDGDLDELLHMTVHLEKGPEHNNMDTGLYWFECLQKVLGKLAAPPAPQEAREPLTDVELLDWLVSRSLIFTQKIKSSSGNFTELKFGSGIAVEGVFTDDVRTAIRAAIAATAKGERG